MLHYIANSSIIGLNAVKRCKCQTRPCFGVYHATKFALEGLTETLAKEVASFGIRVTLVEPGPMRTDFNTTMPVGRQTIEDYAELRASAMESLRVHGADPATAASAIVEAICAETPPLHFVVGKTALEGAREKVCALSAELSAWESLSVSGS